MLASMLRPDSLNLPLFVHVLGAMILVGGLLATSASVIVARGDVRTLRIGVMTLLFVCLPGYIVMRGGAQWIYSREHLDELPDDPAWIGIGFITADAGALLLADLAHPRRARPASGARRGRHGLAAREPDHLGRPARRLHRRDLGDGREAAPEAGPNRPTTTTGPSPGTRDRPSDTSAPLALRLRLHSTMMRHSADVVQSEPHRTSVGRAGSRVKRDPALPTASTALRGTGRAPTATPGCGTRPIRRA